MFNFPGLNPGDFAPSLPLAMQKGSTQTRFVNWIWRQISIEMPADWEMLQFSTEYARGRCAFADRHQFRAELSWKVVLGETDYDRMVGDYLQRLESEKKIESASRFQKGGWHGFAGKSGKGESTRLGKYLPGIKCLAELVIIWPDRRDIELEEHIIKSGHEVQADVKKAQIWRCFGMEIQAPAGAALAGCTVLPARAELNFSNPKSGDSYVFQRLGMVDTWFDGNMEQWLRSAVGPIRDERIAVRNFGAKNITYIEGSFKPEGLHLRRGQLKAAAWISPSDHRLYASICKRRRPANDPGLAPESLLSDAPDFVILP